MNYIVCDFFFFQAEDGIRGVAVTGVQTCALPIPWRGHSERSEGPDAGEGWYRIEKKAVPVTFVSMIAGLPPPIIPGTWKWRSVMW